MESHELWLLISGSFVSQFCWLYLWYYSTILFGPGLKLNPPIGSNCHEYVIPWLYVVKKHLTSCQAASDFY